MLHGYKKSRLNIFYNLGFLGLNSYEQKHFCFHGGPGGEGDADGSSGALGSDDIGSVDDIANTAQDPEAPGFEEGLAGVVDAYAAQLEAEQEDDYQAAMRSIGRNPEAPLEGPPGLAPADPNEEHFDYQGLKAMDRAAQESKESKEDAVAALAASMAGAQTTEQEQEEARSFEQAVRAAAMEQTEEQRGWLGMLQARTEEEKADEEKSFSSLMSTWAGANDLLDTLNTMDRRGVVAHSREQGVNLEEMSRERAQDMMTAYRSMDPKQQAFYATTIHNMANKDSFGPDKYTDIPFMNFIRDELGLPSYGSGYRGKYEARTGPSNIMVSEEQYDPSTITGADPSSQSGVNISMFNQFAIDNPNMTVEQAMEAYNNEMGPNSINQVSAIELGMLGYAPNAPAGRAAQDNENERERGVQQGLGLLAGFAVSPTGLFDAIFSEGKTGGIGRGINEVASALGIPFDFGMVGRQFGLSTQDLMDAIDIDLPEAPDVPSIGFGGLLGNIFGDPKSPGPDDVDLDSPQSFFDTVATDMTTEEMAAAIDAIMNPEEVDDQPLRVRTPFQTASIPEEDDSGFIPFRERFPELNRSPAWKKRYQELAALYGPKKAKEMMKQEERFV